MNFGAEPSRGGHFLRVLGRFAPGVAVEQAAHYAGMGPYHSARIAALESVA